MLYNQQVDEQTVLSGYQVAYHQIVNNPEHFLQYLTILSNYDPEKGFPTLSKTQSSSFAEKARQWNEKPKGSYSVASQLEPVIVG